MRRSNYDKYPFIQVENENNSCIVSWSAISQELNARIKSSNKTKHIILVECYQGVIHNDVAITLQNTLEHVLWISTESLFKDEIVIQKMIHPDMTDDLVFGYFTRLNIKDYFDESKLKASLEEVDKLDRGTVIVYGTGASLLAKDFDLLIYADMPRWEIQQRMRRSEVDNLGVKNRNNDFTNKYKQGYFIDWRVCDRLKKAVYNHSDYVLDTTIREEPKLVKTKAINEGLTKAITRPFRVVPFFDPGPWGGQWLKEICDLDKTAVNYAWGFDCVPEENSLLLAFGEVKVEIPSINLVFFRAKELLGEQVQARFGDEFPIRFDLLDTMSGGNLSLQVHPLTGYIQEQFGMHYTQDESYYILDAAPDAGVYLGMKKKGTKRELFDSLESAYNENSLFDVEQYVNRWPVKKHDHLSIPAGTIHCSGANTVVLEISATPYLFTFKMWDWNRVGLDGKPRPIHLNHAKNVLQDARHEEWVKQNALDIVREIGSGAGWKEERTGLNDLQFIETRRHWFTEKVQHDTNGNLNVLNLVQGREVIVESPENMFVPFSVHYAETFIIPAAAGAYTIKPVGEAQGTECATIKAYVRF